jgi:hypothetical protein
MAALSAFGVRHTRDGTERHNQNHPIPANLNGPSSRRAAPKALAANHHSNAPQRGRIAAVATGKAEPNSNGAIALGIGDIPLVTHDPTERGKLA